MSPMQKQAWFNLAVIGVTAILVATLAPFMGRAAVGAFGVLGLLGFGPLFVRRKAGTVVLDERDALIQRKSALIGYSVFWVVFVAAVMLASWWYSDRGAVPIVFVQSSVWCGLMLLFAVTSCATLMQYGRK
jgi:hypothetical protein